MKKLVFALNGLFVFAWVLSACDGIGAAPQPTPIPLPPAQHVESAFQWLQTHAMLKDNINWTALRQNTADAIAHAKTTADTIPLICSAMRQLKDGNTWMLVPTLEIPSFYTGYGTLYPDNRVIISIDAGSPAEKVGLKVGDVIVERNGQPPKPYNSEDLPPPCNIEPIDKNPRERLTLLRNGQSLQITLDKGNMNSNDDPYHAPVGQRFGAETRPIGYIELPVEFGSHAAYATDVQNLVRKLDNPPSCGWIIDLRRNQGGDIWTYIAAVGPILGEGELGGFVYLDGTREAWTYRDGKVYWNKEERGESKIDGAVYRPKKAAPVALLTSADTTAAGELMRVAFQGRPETRSFGEPTRGLATLVTHTQLSDGNTIFISGANAFDRNGTVFSASIPPDVLVANDWSKFGTAQDPVINAATGWLQSLPACKP